MGGFAATLDGGRSGGGPDAAGGAKAGNGMAGALGGAAGMGDLPGGGGAGQAGDGSEQAGQGGEGGVVNVPGFDDLIVESDQMTAYEGLTVIATFDHNFGPDSRSPPRSAIVTGGAFSLGWQQGFDRDSFGTYVVLFVDGNGDGWCTEGDDPAWSTFANNDTAFEDQPVVVDFDPEHLPSAGGPITCDQFDNWFDEPYEGPPS